MAGSGEVAATAARPSLAGGGARSEDAETDAAGALVIAERIRERVKALVFETGQGPLRVTLSLGIAAVPDDATRKGDLVERADACLYHAKRNGRDRSVSASSLRAAAPARLGRAAAAATSPEPAGP